MKATFKFVLQKNYRKKLSGNSALYLRITINIKSKYFHTGLWVDQLYWNGRGVDLLHPSAQEINSAISRINDKVDTLVKFSASADLP